MIAFYLIIAKINETNLQQPDLDQFPSLNTGDFLESKDIINFELYILNYMNYDIIDFSAYDWLNVSLAMVLSWKMKFNQCHLILLMLFIVIQRKQLQQ